jgi:hypothetical protein
MSVLPVIMREMRAQARQPLTHWLRIVGGIWVVGAIAAALWSMRETHGRQMPGQLMYWARVTGSSLFAGPAPSQFQSFGTTLFSKMNLFIFTSIWLFVPLASADALSRERREGILLTVAEAPVCQGNVYRVRGVLPQLCPTGMCEPRGPQRHPIQSGD